MAVKMKFTILFLTLALVSSLVLLILSWFELGYKFAGYCIVIWLFSAIYFICLMLFRLLKLKQNIKVNLSVMLLFMTLSFIVAEFILRHTNVMLTALELKYSGRYISPF